MVPVFFPLLPNMSVMIGLLTNLYRFVSSIILPQIYSYTNYTTQPSPPSPPLRLLYDICNLTFSKRSVQHFPFGQHFLLYHLHLSHHSPTPFFSHPGFVFHHFSPFFRIIRTSCRKYFVIHSKVSQFQELQN